MMTAVKEGPIIMQAESVRGILDLSKTQSRRIIKLQPDSDPTGRWSFCVSSTNRNQNDTWGYHVIDPNGHTYTERGTEREVVRFKCRYRQVGERLWVREKWRIVGWQEGEPFLIEFEDGSRMEDRTGEFDYDEDATARYWQECSDDCDKAGLKVNDYGRYESADGVIPTRWRNAIFMPRWASRLTLEITDIRVQRVQEISEEDARAEGIHRFENIGYTGGDHIEYGYHWRPEKLARGCQYPNARQAYANLFNRINGPGSWERNDWVWCLTFCRVTP